MRGFSPRKPRGFNLGGERSWTQPLLMNHFHFSLFVLEEVDSTLNN
jgi:hypothetical protein